MFEALKPAPTAVETCESKIQESILSGELAVGDRLPSERTLAEHFQLNRLTVRAALARLTASGLISVRQGRGYQINDIRRSGSSDLIKTLHKQCDSSEDKTYFIETLFQIRRGLYLVVLETLLDVDQTRRQALCEQLDHLIGKLSCATTSKTYAETELNGIRDLLCTLDNIPLILTINPVLNALHEDERLWDINYANKNRKADGYRIVRYWIEQKDDDAIFPMMAELKRLDMWTVRQLQSKQFNS